MKIKKFADLIGFAPQVVSNIVSGRKSKPSFDVLRAILSLFDDISAEWLLIGKGEMKKSFENKEEVSQEEPYEELERKLLPNLVAKILLDLDTILEKHKKSRKKQKEILEKLKKMDRLEQELADMKNMLAKVKVDLKSY